MVMIKSCSLVRTSADCGVRECGFCGAVFHTYTLIFYTHQAYHSNIHFRQIPLKWYSHLRVFLGKWQKKSSDTLKVSGNKEALYF